MPWKQIWVPPEENSGLEVLEALPDGVAEERFSLTWNLKQATGRTADGEYRQFHFCPKCEGWIPGLAAEHSVNTLDSRHLAGRQGTEYYCRRCGYQIAFHGRVS